MATSDTGFERGQVGVTDQTQFAGRTLRAVRTGIVGFGSVAQVHCRYLLSEDATGANGKPSILTIFPGIHDMPGDTWPPRLVDPLLVKAVASASILFVEECVSSIQPVPGRKGGGYVIETSQGTYAFREVWLEPADFGDVPMDAAAATDNP